MCCEEMSPIRPLRSKDSLLLAVQKTHTYSKAAFCSFPLELLISLPPVLTTAALIEAFQHHLKTYLGFAFT